MQRLTALELRSGVKSSSAISTQPNERTEKRMAGDFGGAFRDSMEALAPSATGKLLRLFDKIRQSFFMIHWAFQVFPLLEGHILFGADAVQVGERKASSAPGNHWSEAGTNSLAIKRVR